MRASTKVFDILELATLIADHLNQHDLATCCLISHSFFDTFIPHLWHSITFQRFDPIPKFQSPEGQAGLLRNGHYIRVIRAYNLDVLEPFLDYGKTCTNLICLDAEQTGSRAADSGRSQGVVLSGRRGSIGAGQKQVKGNRHLHPFKEGPLIGVRHANNIKVLLSIIHRNPGLQFLILPVFCFKSEALVKAMAQTLLELKELYSPSQTWRWGDFKEYTLSSSHPRYTSRFKTKPTASMAGVLQASELKNVPGSVLSTVMFDSTPLLQKYPRLAGLEREKFSGINQEAIQHIRTTSERLPYIQIHSGDSYGINLMLNAASGLKGIHLLLEDERESMYDIDDISQEAFLKHALTLECLDVLGYDFDVQIFNAILSSSPNLEIVRVIEKGYVSPNRRMRLDASMDFFIPWASSSLEVFECFIGGVLRPDVTLAGIIETGNPPPAAPEQELSPAQFGSYAAQKRVLAQLGRLTYLRKLRLGTHSNKVYNPVYRLLRMRGKQTMAVNVCMQTDCLEFSLESGLEELAGLKELEELNVNHMAHRIGVPEVQWMVAHWPKLKAIRGLRYIEYNSQYGGRIPDIGVMECVRWMREHRPDIILI
ncbi:hypothetical protein BGZ88_011786 [Linnemannia elongata]|nr:hypothetical protein BGZ88_011786 [Linnemannia elongata]